MVILTDIKEIFSDIFDNENLIINTETASKDIEEWDSLAHIRLASAIEKHFSIKFTFKELQEMKNVGNMVRIIEEKLNIK